MSHNEDTITQFKLIFAEFQRNYPRHWLRKVAQINDSLPTPDGLVCIADVGGHVIAVSYMRGKEEWNEDVAKFVVANKVSHYAALINGEVILPAGQTEFSKEAAEIDTTVEYDNVENLWTRQLPEDARETAYELYQEISTINCLC